MDDRYERDIIEVARDYARHGLIHKRRDCPFCTCPMLLVRNAESRSQLIWQCGRCGISKGLTMNTPLCYMDIKMFDISLYLWIDNVWPRLAQNIVRDRSGVIKNFQLIRKCCSMYIKTKVLPYVKLPGPIEIDETRLGRQKLSKCTVFARKINRVFGIFCRTTHLPLFYYIPDRKHPTLTKIIRKHLPLSGSVVSDTMTSYVRPRSEASRLDQYGYHHYFINIT
jgi:ribosomal protein S27AE